MYLNVYHFGGQLYLNESIKNKYGRMKKDENYKKLHVNNFDNQDEIKFLKYKYNTSRAHWKKIDI